MATTVTIDGSPEIEITLIDESPEISVELHDESPVIQVDVIGTGPVGKGIAAGGSPGQVLRKASPTDYDTEFQDTVIRIDGYINGTTVSVSDLGFTTTDLYVMHNRNIPIELRIDKILYRLVSCIRYRPSGELMYKYRFEFCGMYYERVLRFIAFGGINVAATSMTGLATDWDLSDIGDLSALVTTHKSNLVEALNEVARGAKIPVGSLASVSTSTVMVANLVGIPQLADGVCLWLKNGVVTSAAGVTLNVNHLGAKPIYISQAEATPITTQFNVNYTALLIYNSTRVPGGCWDYVYGYESGGGGGTSDYEDLDNLPKIGGVTLIGNKSLADIGAGTYSKPSGGIPDTDLDATVRAALALALTALQSFTETDPTVPSWAKAASKPSYSKSEIGLDNVDNTSDANKPVSTAQQAALDAKENKVTEVTVSTAGAVSQALDAGKLYHFTGALTALTITLNAAASGQLAQYHFDFSSGSTAPTVTLPNTVTMQGGTFAPEASKRYEVDILNGYGVSMAW